MRAFSKSADQRDLSSSTHGSADTSTATGLRVATIAGGSPGAAAALDFALDVLQDLGVEVHERRYDLGAERYLRTGEILTAGELAELRTAHALLCASPPATADLRISRGLLERGLVFGLRRALQLAINVRVFCGVGSRAGADIAVVRENSQGLYFAEPTTYGTPTGEIAVETAITTRAAVEHCLRFAFELAQSRRGALTIAHKTGVLVGSGAVWEAAAATLASEYADVTVTIENADTCCARLIKDPRRYDVIATDNVFGDIVSDVACAGVDAGAYAASAEYSALPGGPSLFEPMHGSDDTSARGGQALRPLGMASAVAMMLTATGSSRLGEALRQAVMASASESNVGATDEALRARLVQLATERAGAD